MFEVSGKAQEMIKKVLESQDDKRPVRVLYSGGG